MQVAEIQAAIERAAPYLLRDGVDHKSQVIFALPQLIFDSLTFDYFLSQRLVDSFNLQCALGDATFQVLVKPLNFGARPPVHG